MNKVKIASLLLKKKKKFHSYSLGYSHFSTSSFKEGTWESSSSTEINNHLYKKKLWPWLWENTVTFQNQHDIHGLPLRKERKTINQQVHLLLRTATVMKSCGPSSHSNEKGVVFKFMCTLVIRSTCHFLVIPTSTNNYKTKIALNIFMPHSKIFTFQFCTVSLKISNSPVEFLDQKSYFPFHK